MTTLHFPDSTPKHLLEAYVPQPEPPLTSRDVLMQALSGLVPPPNYRVVLDVHQDNEKLVLKVLKRDNWEVKFLGLTCWRYTQAWDAPGTEQRRIEGRTYDALIHQLNDCPEFLEFEKVFEGRAEYRVAVSM